MANPRLVTVIGGFGLVVIVSGLIRYLSTPAGQNGLYFGLVTGGLALVGAVFAAFNLRILGQAIGLLAIAFVALWFGYDLYRDLANKFVFGPDEIRKIFVLAAGAVAAALIVRRA